MNLDRLAEHFREHDRFAAANGIRLIELAEGTAIAEMAVEERHLNGLESVHGGALFALADFAFAAACNSRGTVSVAVSATIHFVKGVRGGRLRAHCREVADGKLAHYETTISDDEGNIVAVFSGLAYRKREALFPE